MKRKWLAVGIIVLFVAVGVVPSTGGITIEKIVFTNFTTRGYIQGLIDNASDGDTIVIPSGTYYENIIINKSITLIGEDKNTTIIDGGEVGYVVYVSVDRVTISGFTIQNSGNNTWEDVGIFIDKTDNNTITGNIIANNSCGIYCYQDYYADSDYHIISENIIINNWLGVFLDRSVKNEVYENYIADNTWFGIFVGSSVLPLKSMEHSLDENEFYNNIYRNTITKNDHGIYMNIAFYNNVFENTITNNYYGIRLAPAFLCGCDGNTIYQNNINNNTYGIFAGDDLGTIMGNTLSKNSIMFNTEGITFSVYQDGSFYTEITRNIISYNNFIGNTNTFTFEYSLFNHWIGNYWGKARLLPYPLIGKLRIFNYIFPWITFDWHPGQKPYDIGG